MTATKLFAIAIALIATLATPALCADGGLNPADIPGADAWDVPGEVDEVDRQAAKSDWSTVDFVGHSEVIEGEYIPERRDRWDMARIGMVARGKYPFMENTTTGYTRPKDMQELFSEMDGETVSRMLTPEVSYSLSEDYTYVFVSDMQARHFFPAYIERSEKSGVEPRTTDGATVYDKYRVVSFYGVWQNAKLGRIVRFFDLRLPDWEHRVVWQDSSGNRQTTEWTRSGAEASTWLSGIATPSNWGRVEHRYSPVASMLIIHIEGRQVWRGDYRQIPD
ncbi:MAG: hypothetical protein BWY19_00608 [bacterium ADurb.Bin212]|nr:MAG: hypothetical protein BWY19_00608 [bacterium ADurb.Bin212]